MARLPVPGSDANVWGDVLNNFLLAEHNADGTLKIAATVAAKADDSTVVHKAGDTMTGVLSVPGGTVTPLDWVNVKTQGAKGDGATDDTAAIQNAINAGGATYFPTGTYMVSGLTLQAKTVLMGTGSGTYSGFVGAGVSAIKLINGSNSPVITIPAGAGAGRITDLEIDGNKNGQTAGLPQGILFAAAGSAQESQWRIERCFVHATRGTGIEIQSNRQANRIRDCAIYGTGYYGIECSASDQILTGNLIGVCFLDGVLVNQTVIHIFAGDIFSNRNGVNITASARGCMITNTGIDRNNQAGIYCAGAGVSVTGCTFHTNSQTADGTYPNIQITDQFSAADAINVTGCSFWKDSGYANLPDYHIRLDNTATAGVVACGAQTASSRSGFINAPSRSGPLVSKPAITGSRGGNAALTSLLTALASLGIVTDSTT